MASDDQSNPLTESGLTIPSDSEQYSRQDDDVSPSPPSSSNSPQMILYKPPTFWGILRGAAINLFLPFVNGLMLGFGELFAHEAAFRLGWSNTKVRYYCATGANCDLFPIHIHRSGLVGLRLAMTYLSAPHSPTKLILTTPSPQIFPDTRRTVGPGVEIRPDPIERKRREGNLDDLTSLE
jgi:hypothetical protein